MSQSTFMTRTKRLSKNIKQKLSMAGLSPEILRQIADGSPELKAAAKAIIEHESTGRNRNAGKLVITTKFGRLYQGDCLELFNRVPDRSVDLVFADPPFNLAKDYGGKFRDDLEESRYWSWTRQWLDAACEKLKPGGSLFVFHIPKWAIPIANHLNQHLEFRHWIAVDLTLSFPLNRRLYPSHYSLLYFVKGGSPNRFSPPRLPIESCRRCGKELHDYGGHKTKMNPLGVNLRDVWVDIPPVRHRRNKNRMANELNVKLLDRVLDIATREGDTVLDPFGGSGTTFAVAEIKRRKWIGFELGSCGPIRKRLNDLQQDRDSIQRHRNDLNRLFTDQTLVTRIRNGLPINNYQIEDDQIERVLNIFKKPRWQTCTSNF